MKKINILKLVSLIMIASLAGCASYRAIPLNTLCTENSCTIPNRGDIVVMAKVFDKHDCKKYLDRDVIRQGYRPVQLHIDNKSDRNYFFSLNRLSLPCARPEEVADSVHTSTIARATGYGAAALIFWPFVVPAIVDGVKSAQANEALDSDFFSKTARDSVIESHTRMNLLVFVPLESYKPIFNMTLIDLKTNQPRDFVIQVIN